ncbi:MAG: GtrA family protein [Candidatus Obscuribacterales bacterium]|nr:GtrA family protein [Steroidobacteraceae bacterium]
MPIRELTQRFVMFVGVGAVGTAAHFAVLLAFVEIFSLNPTLSSACGFVVGAVVNYLLNYRFTFDSNRRHIETAPRFATVAAIGGVLNVVIVHFGTETLSMNYIVSQVVSTGMVLVFNFVANSLWTFATRASMKR